MIICICHRVSDHDIRRAVHSGCDSFDDLQDHLRVATACGACTGCAQQVFGEQALPCHRGAACSQAQTLLEAA